MEKETLWVDFKKQSLDNDTSIWYETLVFHMTILLKYFPERDVYAQLDYGGYSPDTLHYAIDEAKELMKR